MQWLLIAHAPQRRTPRRLAAAGGTGQPCTNEFAYSNVTAILSIWLKNSAADFDSVVCSLPEGRLCLPLGPLCRCGLDGSGVGLWGETSKKDLQVHPVLAPSSDEKAFSRHTYTDRASESACDSDEVRAAHLVRD